MKASETLTFGVVLGDYRWEILKIQSTPSGFYMILLVPELGLHFTIHPRGPRIVHFKSKFAGKEISPEILSEEFWRQGSLEFLSRGYFRSLSEVSDEKIWLIPLETEGGLDQAMVETSRTVWLDLAKLMRLTETSRTYLTRERKIPELLQEHPIRKALIYSVDEPDIQLLTGSPVPSLVRIGNLTELVEGHGATNPLKWWFKNAFGSTRIGRVLFEPMASVMEESLRHVPEAFEKWLPPRA
jgi:hypothetical protein